MKLPIPFKSDNKEKEDYYLALLLTDEKVSAVILKNKQGKVTIINTHEEFFTEPLETFQHEELTEVIDKSITRAEEILPPNIETHKTVFGVKQSWIDDETKKIKKDYLNKLKKVCDSLDLTPIGFMIVTEAVIHLLQEDEGAPLSAVLAEIGRKHVALTLLRGGKILETVNGEIEGTSASTIDKLLKHFTVAVLPARIILFPMKEAESLSQQFIKHQWSKSLPFLHVPQITVLPNGYDSKAVTFGAAAQMGLDVTEISQLVKPHELTLPDATADEETKDDTGKDIPGIPDEASPHAGTAPLTAVSHAGEAFGFMKDQDIATMETPELDKELYEEKNDATFEEIIKRRAYEEEKIAEREEREDTDENNMYDRQPFTRHERGKKKMSFDLSGIFAAIKLPSLNINPGEFVKSRGIILLIFIVFILIILGVGVSYLYLNKVNASIVLTIEPKAVTQTTDVVFSTASTSDFSKNIVAAKQITASVDGSMSTNATGKKEVGDKAKGSVTVYNSSDSSVDLNSGTQIKSSKGLLFTLDKDITIASGSSNPINPKSGTAKVDVTAKEIGTDYNLPSGTEFSIVGGSDKLAAKNDSAFSGGTKRTVTVVAKEDLSKLEKDLPKSQENKAKEALSEKIDSGQTLIQGVTSTSLDKPAFDKKAGDEAKQVKLTATVLFTGAAYNNNELDQYAQSVLKNKYSKDISFAQNSMKINVSDIEQKDDDTIRAKAGIVAGLLPKIDTDDVLKQLENKSLKDAKATLTSLPQVANSEIKFSPNIPFLPNLFPRLPNNISVVMQSE